MLIKTYCTNFLTKHFITVNDKCTSYKEACIWIVQTNAYLFLLKAVEVFKIYKNYVLFRNNMLK